jgi:hypothetical protein
MTLAAGDHAEIHNLYARYATLFDEGDGDGWAALFARDGRFVRDGQPDVVGQDELRGFALERMADAPDLRHFVTNVCVEASPEGAVGSAYALVLRVGGDSLGLRTMGTYDDELVREEREWRIQTRRYRPWLAPGLVDASFVLD